jgi:hypothetical protein
MRVTSVQVCMQAALLPKQSLAQLLREAALREEWRVGREQSLLAALRSLSASPATGGSALRALLSLSQPSGTGEAGAAGAEARVLAEHWDDMNGVNQTGLFHDCLLARSGCGHGLRRPHQRSHTAWLRGRAVQQPTLHRQADLQTSWARAKLASRAPPHPGPTDAGAAAASPPHRRRACHRRRHGLWPRLRSRLSAAWRLSQVRSAGRGGGHGVAKREAQPQPLAWFALCAPCVRALCGLWACVTAEPDA